MVCWEGLPRLVSKGSPTLPTAAARLFEMDLFVVNQFFPYRFGFVSRFHF